MLPPEPMAAAGLQGRRVLITRSADRARTLAALLRSKGAIPLVLPLIDFEQATDQASLDSALDTLAAGGYEWLVVSSTTTLRVLIGKAAERGTTASQLVPAGTKVATVGLSSQRALEAAGLHVDLCPTGEQSAEGLLELWDAPNARIFLPQADIASPHLREGLAAKGATVDAVTAYHTVEYPAHDSRRLTAELPAAVGLSDDGLPPQLTAEAVKARLGAGALDAIVAASPSAVRRISQALLPLGACRLVAIGRPTAAEAARIGLPVAATAKEPTPAGIATALETIFANEGNPQ
ncbi:uroporphyrinogen-III synthase [Paenarthrobacter sp. NPDC089989]|uniref:uroporphyrinogen-III synthase n=1 Tax=unclassified Paenarthrobacter TaxID=2634190 RepID=UPI0037F27FDC